MDHAAFECARCGVHLPLKRDLAAEPDESSWACLNCGWQMPGVLDPDARDSIADNVARVSAPKTTTGIRRREHRHNSDSLLEKIVSRYFTDAVYRA
jgi:hypothetical protein